ncbi:MAG: GNAT family protein [Aggregatilineales bacterium]
MNFYALAQTGFTDEGCLRQEVYRNGRYLDKIIFSMLRREWSPTSA